MNNEIKAEATVDPIQLAQEAANRSGQNNGFFIGSTETPAVTPPVIPEPVYEAKEVPETPIQHSPKPGTPRWNEIYHKAKQADKLKSELSELKNQVSTLMQNMGNVNLTNITTEISNTELKYKEALEAGDYNAAARLNTQMMDLMNQKQSAVNTFTPKQFNQPAEEVAPITEAINEQYQQPQPPIEAIVAAQTFEQNNPWYVNDPVLQAAFNAMHRETMHSEAFSDKPIAAQLNESLRKFKGAFPEKFRQVTPPSAVAPVTPSAPPSNMQQVTLTEEEKKAAVMFAPPGSDPVAAQQAFLENKLYYMRNGVQF